MSAAIGLSANGPEGTEIEVRGPFDMVAVDADEDSWTMTVNKMSIQPSNPIAPIVSSDGATPGYLSTKHFDPTLRSFAGAAGVQDGGICGYVSAAQLVAMGTKYLPYGTLGCTGSELSTLDLLVSGCGGYFAATQPDTIVAGSTPVGAGGPYTLTINAFGHVGQCTDSAGTTVDLQACLANVAYSTWFAAGIQRAIPTL